ncbi:MAG: rhomboid family intramembrane serine protease [Lachnospiraceae bacterium]|nr:rhomboid family intramembrane serine protease [Lachnospiraceae bacterium]
MPERITAFFRRSPVTFLLVAVNIVVFVLETIAGGSTKTQVALLFGAQTTPHLAAGQYWRLFTAMFLHFGITHLACNMISLINLGPAIERVYGKARYLCIYFCAGLAGNLLTVGWEMHTQEFAVSAGASGAIFGLFGAYAALALIPSMRQFLSLRGIVITLVLNLAYGMTYRSVNMAAHAGGMIGGALIAAVMILVIRHRARRGSDASR